MGVRAVETMTASLISRLRARGISAILAAACAAVSWHGPAMALTRRWAKSARMPPRQGAARRAMRKSKHANGNGVGGELLRDAKEVTTIEDRWHVVGEGHPPKRP